MLNGTLRRAILFQAVLAALCVLSVAWCRFFLHLSTPFGSPFLPGWSSDFKVWVPMMREAHTRAFFSFGYPFLYPPAAAPFQYFFSIIPWRPTLWFYLADAAVVVAVVVLFARAMQRGGARSAAAFLFAGTLAVVSFPLWFTLRQGNIELLLFVFTAGGVWAYLRGSHGLAAACFGIAGAAKLYPFLLLGLFVSRKQWRYLAMALLTAVLVSLASLWLIYPDLRIAMRETQVGMRVASDLQFLHQNPFQGGYDHSLLGAYKRSTTTFPAPEKARTLVRAYIACLGVIGLLAYFLRLRTLPVLNQVLGLTCAAVTFMPLSYDYTLLHLYIPFGMLALQLQKGVQRAASRQVWLALGCFSLVFAPLTEFIFHLTSFSGLIKTAALVGLFAISLWRPLDVSAPAQAG